MLFAFLKLALLGVSDQNDCWTRKNVGLDLILIEDYSQKKVKKNKTYKNDLYNFY